MRSCLKRLLSLSVVLVFVAAFYSIGVCERVYAGNGNGTTGGGPVDYDGGSSGNNGNTDTGTDGSGKPWKSFGNDDIDETEHFLGTTNDNDIVIKTNNAEKARITSEGNVGIGTDTPTGILHVDGGSAEGTADGTDITIKAQDGGVGGGAGGNIVLAPGSGIMKDANGNPILKTDEFGNYILDDEGNPIPVSNDGKVIIAGNIAPLSDDVNSLGTPEMVYKDIYLGSNIHYEDDGLIYKYKFWNEREEAWQSVTRIVFTWDGKLGIGTELPTEKLHVIGNVLATGNVDATSFTGDGSALTGTSAADTILQNNIDAEAGLRSAADDVLQGNIDAEGATRAAADTANSGAITANTTAITNEAATRGAADTTLQDNIDAEEAARLAAVAASDGAIATNPYTRVVL